MQKLTTEEFIKRAKEVHGNKYDYSKTKYVNSSIKVCITCPEHGDFYISTHAHLGGQGCRECGIKLTSIKNSEKARNEFIKKAREKHGDKYDYSKVEYINQYTPVCIICPEHGEFWQCPKQHLKGQGCIKCSMPNRNLNVEKFIEKAREKHGNKYDYSKVDSIKRGVKVCIICPEHGEFWQEPFKHLYGSGCRRCTEPNFGITTEEFIEKAKQKFGDKYDYSKVKCNEAKSKVCIICPEHGEFWKTPYHHLKGQGCPNCTGVRKAYKFNLLKEFESEYEFKAFLENNDPNILLAILNNICETDSKFNPIKKDLEKALENSEKEDPISKLEEKYSSNTVDDEIEVEEDTAPIKIDLDNEEQFDEIFGKFDNADEEKELTIEDAIKNTEKEIKIINKIDHLIAPELRKKIKKKLKNDMRRQFMELNRI